MTPESPPQSDKRALARRLAEWGRAGAAMSHAASALGIAQYALFIGFAWGAANALANLAGGGPVGPWLAAAAGFALVRAAAQAGETRLGVEASARVRADVRRRAAAGLSRRGPAWAERAETGETASALVDAVEKLDGYFGRYRPLMPVVAIAPFVILAAAFPASRIVAAIFLVTAPFLILFMALVGAGAAAASRDQLTVLSRLAGRFNDRLQALETLNAFNAAEREAKGLAAAADDFRRRTMKVLRLAFLSSGILEFFAALAVAATAVYVGFSLLGELPFNAGETVTLRTGVFVLILAPEFYMPLRRLSAAYHDRADAEAAAEALAPLFEDVDETPAAPPRLTAAPAVVFEQAGSVYADGRRGLAPLSFTAEAGAITALWGASGAGKSTALKLMMGYAPLSEGRILIDGEALAAPLIGEAAWIAQRPRVFHGGLADNITLFDPDIPVARVRAAAEAAGVTDFADSLPDGLETRVGDRGYGLSGGQAQRVALARALAADMKLLLLDEPTAHLDGEAEARFLDALRRAASGRTVIIATHSPAVRAVCDAVIDLEARKAAA
ncbi:thiol reductant ABC exporter subunit CydD [Marinicauda salina]|uniref:Thiol reductant ABC exporter subunit CydD n=1 Tax=Marinicauda salina TaxID=2135793 RepID=A0A2U2BS58_9PROT|nr:thiol reductant ABC exporter subunit CydD [Marinicauda salina]PWE16857.1 thiol reductant ABC exporter subunit CydD [Marinicauda salina]